MGLIKRITRWARRKSPFVYHLYSGTCNGCDIELATSLTPYFDIERYGCVLSGTPRHADVIVVTGCMVKKCRDSFVRVFERIPEPNVRVAIGNCAISGGMFAGSYSVGEPVDKYIPIDVYVPGCPPRPEAILEGIKKALELF